MHEAERLSHQLHARLPTFARKVEQAQTSIEEALGCMHAPYVAFSGGIDSTVLLDLLFQAGYHLPVLWGDDGYDYPESLTFLRESEQRYGFHLQRIRCMQPWRDWCLEMARPDLAEDPAARASWGNPPLWDATWNSLKDASLHAYDGVFLGLLACESRGRRYALKGGRRVVYQVQGEGGMWHCSPLAQWSKRDIWAYAIARNLPYNPVYDRLAAYGIPCEQRRVAPLTCFRVVQYGSHVWLKSGWPDLYNSLAGTFPRVRSSV